MLIASYNIAEFESQYTAEYCCIHVHIMHHIIRIVKLDYIPTSSSFYFEVLLHFSKKKVCCIYHVYTKYYLPGTAEGIMYCCSRRSLEERNSHPRSMAIVLVLHAVIESIYDIWRFDVRCRPPSAVRGGARGENGACLGSFPQACSLL